MIFSSSRSTSATTFRNLHTPANQPRSQLSELWERATVPPVGRAKRQDMALTWRGSGALEEPSIAMSKTSFAISA
jgi:hypothetical protein